MHALTMIPFRSIFVTRNSNSNSNFRSNRRMSTTAKWQRGLDEMFMNVEQLITFGLRNIAEDLGASGLAFDDEFRQMLIRMSNDR